MRSEEERLAGIVRVKLAGDYRSLAELPIKPMRAWTEKLTGIIGPIAATELAGQKDTGEFVTGLIGSVGEYQLELVIAYDQLGNKVLPSRAVLETKATQTELYDALVPMLETAFPFVRSLQAGVALAGQLMKAARSALASSTSGPSPTGALTPGPSTSG